MRVRPPRATRSDLLCGSVSQRLGIKHPEAFWTAVLVFFTNLAAVQIFRLFDHSVTGVVIATLATSTLAAIAVYAKVRLADAKKEKRLHDDRPGPVA